MTNIQKVNKCEEEGRQLLASYFDQQGIQYECTTNITDQIDMIATDKKGQKIVVEIKTRNEKYENYPTFYFELVKYEGMVKRMTEEGAVGGLYVCIFGTHIYIYSIKTIVEKTPITYKWLPANSFGDGTFKSKAIYDFKKDLAFRKIQLDNNNKWIEL